MKFILALSITCTSLGAFAAGPALRHYGHKYSATVFTPKKCDDRLKLMVVVRGPNIRGDLVAKIEKAFPVKLPTRFAELQSQGILFGHDDLVSGNDGVF